MCVVRIGTSLGMEKDRKKTQNWNKRGSRQRVPMKQNNQRKPAIDKCKERGRTIPGNDKGLSQQTAKTIY